MKNMCGSGYPTYPNFLSPTLNFFLHFGQTVHLKKKMKGKACILKVFFIFDMNPTALRKAKIVYKFSLSECNRVKRKKAVFCRGHEDNTFCNIFLFFLLSKVGIYILMKKVKIIIIIIIIISFLPTYLIFSGCNLNHTYFFYLALFVGCSIESTSVSISGRLPERWSKKK